MGLWRHLATQQPARHTPSLALSLTNLGVGLRGMGRYQDALAAHEEAVSLWRDLATQRTPDLALSLHNFGVSLQEMGRYQDALATFEEAVARGGT